MADCRTEHQEQVALFTWATVMSGRHPELKLLYAIPNAAKRSPAQARYMLSEGLKKGVPDICLPCARQGYHGLYIELKRIKGGVTSPDQKEWIAALKSEGYKAIVCKGFDEAREAIEDYLGIKHRRG